MHRFYELHTFEKIFLTVSIKTFHPSRNYTIHLFYWGLRDIPGRTKTLCQMFYRIQWKISKFQKSLNCEYKCQINSKNSKWILSSISVAFWRRKNNDDFPYYSLNISYYMYIISRLQFWCFFQFLFPIFQELKFIPDNTIRLNPTKYCFYQRTGRQIRSHFLLLKYLMI